MGTFRVHRSSLDTLHVARPRNPDQVHVGCVSRGVPALSFVVQPALHGDAIYLGTQLFKLRFHPFMLDKKSQVL